MAGLSQEAEQASKMTYVHIIQKSHIFQMYPKSYKLRVSLTKVMRVEVVCLSCINTPSLNPTAKPSFRRHFHTYLLSQMASETLQAAIGGVGLSAGHCYWFFW